MYTIHYKYLVTKMLSSTSTVVKLSRCLSCAVVESTSKKLNECKLDIAWKAARPFEEIPGPKSLPIIGNSLRFIPKIGKYDGLNLDKMLGQLHEDFGDIVKLDGIYLRRPIVFLFSPALCEAMYKTEGNSPMRVPIECVQHYSKMRRLKDSLGNGQGKEWREFRTKVNQPMLKPQIVTHHIKQIEEVAKEFIHKMRKMRNPENFKLPPDFNNELYKWSLETICLICLDHRLGCLNDHLKSDDEAQQMINAIHEMFDSMYKLERLPLWKVFGDTPQLKRFFQATDTVTEIANKYVGITIQKLKNNSEFNMHDCSMLERLLLSADEDTARLMVRDMLGGGVDTVSNTVGKVLYAIVSHPHAQAKLFAELQAALPCVDSSFTEETMKNIPYLQACIKEAMRLFPPTIGTPRTTQKDIVLAGFRIPKGTNVLASYSIMCQKPEQFPEPQKFIPDRWLRDDVGNVRSASEAHPFSFLPFGIGPRACVAKRLAEHEMQIIVAKIVRNFELEWDNGPLVVKHQLISTIVSELKLKILDRPH